MTPESTAPRSQAEVISQWREAWPRALAVWSKFTRLSDPQLCSSSVIASKEGLTGSFAMIRLADQSVVVDLEGAGKLGLHDYALEILAHEIGHHVLAPANATDHFRLLARIRKGLPTLEQHAPMIANLFTDLLINNRLQRRANLSMADIYRKLSAASGPATEATLWALYLRMYEHLWKLPKGDLGAAVDDANFDTDAWLGARIISVYADDWLKGAGRFAALVLPYLVKENFCIEEIQQLMDTQGAAQDCEPAGILDIEADEDDALHPLYDANITGDEANAEPATDKERLVAANNTQGAGQMREPFEYGEIIKAGGIRLSDHDIAVRYYEHAALPHLIPFPTREAPTSTEPLIEGLEPWDIGDALDEVDWLQTLSASPIVVPGLTTVRRTYGMNAGADAAREPIDLDLYVDSSGSMPNPQQRISYLTLAGAVIALSALRVGARVQATLWSGKQQCMSTQGFVTDARAVLKILTGFYGGATAFPIHKLRDTFQQRRDTERACHILHISDDGITTMFDQDERGNSGWDIAAMALSKARGGGTMALQLWSDWRKGTHPVAENLRRAHDEQGWEIFAIAAMADLLDFARAFSRRHYSQRDASARTMQ